MAEPTALWIAQEFCRRISLPLPTTLTGAQDDTTRQIWGLMNEGVQDLVDRYNLPELKQEKVFQHAGGTGYLAYDIAGLPDFRFYCTDTLWDATGRLPVAGPLSMVQWQQTVTMVTAAAKYCYAFFGNAFRIFPEPDPLNSVNFSFYYQSRYGVLDATAPNGASAETYLTDSSTPRVPWHLVIADLKWRYKKEKGLPYAEDQRTLEQMLVNHVGREPLGDLVLDVRPEAYIAPALLIPAGSWDLP